MPFAKKMSIGWNGGSSFASYSSFSLRKNPVEEICGYEVHRSEYCVCNCSVFFFFLYVSFEPFRLAGVLKYHKQFSFLFFGFETVEVIIRFSV